MIGGKKIGVVDVGGGYRGIYACGVLDRCIEEGVRFDVGIGVSAGSANLSSFAAGQLGRNFAFYTVYGARPQYASLRNFITKGSYIDLDYVYSTLSNTDGENPLDYEAILENPMELFVVATDASTAKPMYFDKSHISKDSYDICKASSAIPLVCKPYPIDGRDYFDGALSDPVPIRRAFELGCDKVVLILTRPVDQLRSAGSDSKLAKGIQRRFPMAAEGMRNRAQRYNEDVQYAKELQAEGKVLIVSPEDTFGVKTLTRNRALLEKLYKEGFADGGKIMDFIEQI